MARGSNPRAGVTLIEILIAISLLSFLSIGILISMRIGFNTMQKVDSRLVSNRRVSYARRIVENEIAGYTMSRADWLPHTPNYQTIAFNQWEAQTMRFVTSYSLQDAWRGRPQIAVLQVIPGEDGTGVRLIVNETPYTGSAQAGEMIAAIDPDGTVHFTQAAAGPQSFVLADRLAYCRFSYLQPGIETRLRIWRPDWVLPRVLPLGIRIDMAPLDNSPANLHVSTITTPLNVDRTPGDNYADTL